MNQSGAFLTLADRRLAYQQRSAGPENKEKPGVVFLSGLASDMAGTKATFLDEKCAAAGLGFLRFDYRGHGLSSDTFENGCIGDWADDAKIIFDKLTKGPQILIGSSMGGWIALLLVRQFPERIVGFIGLAAAPDFTEVLIEPTMTQAQRADMETKGFMFEDGVPEDQRIPITRKLMEDGRKHLILDQKTSIGGPVHLVQGQEDRDVPWRHAFKVAEAIDAPQVNVTLLREADHRLSRPEDLNFIWQIVEGAVSEAGA